ncbi:hypothetical protein [Saccharopolyspora sp. NPDC002376]
MVDQPFWNPKTELMPHDDLRELQLAARLGVELSDAHEGLRFLLRRAATRELPRFELKAKRLTDLRHTG